MIKKYHIWTEGCQMNVADSQRVGSSLEHLGYTSTSQAEEADVIVLNTCVVRQSAEDKAIGRLSSLAPLKKKPELVINLMGCLVGVRGVEKLKARPRRHGRVDDANSRSAPYGWDWFFNPAGCVKPLVPQHRLWTP
jgi:tRNA A37 methylthiotransferase MiaB